MSFEEGIAFLGEDFGPRYPPVLEGAGVRELDRKVLYVARQDTRVRVKQGRLHVDKDDEPILDVPTSHVERVVLFGSVGLTVGARTWAMVSDVDVVLASRRGNYLGVQVAGAKPPRQGAAGSGGNRTGTPDCTQHRQLEDRASDRSVAAVWATNSLRTGAGGRCAHASVLADVAGCGITRRDHGHRGRDGGRLLASLRGLVPGGHALYVAESIAATQHRKLGARLPLHGAARGMRDSGTRRGPGPWHRRPAQHRRPEAKPRTRLDGGEFRPLIVDRVVLTMARHKRLTTAYGRSPEGKSGILLTAAGREATVMTYEAMAF